MLAVHVFVVLLVARALAQKECPPSSEKGCDHLIDDLTKEQQAEFERVRPDAESALRNMVVGSSNVAAELTDNCPHDELADRPPDRSKRMAVTARLWLGKACEPCPPKVHYLRNFFRYCYVIYPWRQWVRYVSCPTSCAQPCWCSNTRCVATRWTRVYFWSWCIRSPGFKFRQGPNYRWVWMPQDCSCHELSFSQVITGG